MLTDREKQEITLYTQIITFSLDGAFRNTKAKNKEIYDELTRIFYKDLYHKREWAEEEMRLLINGSQRVLSFEGIEGCGKSTITRRVLSELKKEYPSLVLDFNILTNDQALNAASNYASFNAAIADILRRELISEFFEKHPERMEALYRFALFPDEVLSSRDFVDERMEMHSLVERNISSVDKEEMQKWYIKNRTTEAVRNIIVKIYKKITYSHLIIVLRDQLPFNERFIVVFDNVDRLPRQWQPYCYNFALSFNNEMYEFAKPILNIRPENAHLPVEITGQRSEHVDSIRLVDLGKGNDFNSYLDSDGFHRILHSRQKAYSLLCSNSALTYKLNLLTNALKDQYGELILIDLANQSIRSALEYHCKFLRYLLETCPFESLKDLIIKNKHRSLLVSCFLGWIAEQGEVLSDQNLNLAKLVNEANRNDFHTRGCDLSYLILVCLSKQTVNSQGEEIYRISFKSLVSRLAILGFTEEEVREEIYHLYFNKNKEFGHIISISNDEIVHDQESVKPKTRISLNFRGLRLLETVSVMFFFVNRLLNKTNGKTVTNMRGEFGYYDYSNYCVHARENVVLLAQVAKLHSIELIRIAERMDSDNWLNQYKRYFTVNSDLQLTRLILSNSRFLSGSQTHIPSSAHTDILKLVDTMYVLLNLYKRCIENINADTEVIYDYEEIVKKCLKDGPPDKGNAEEFFGEENKINVKKLINAK